MTSHDQGLTLSWLDPTECCITYLLTFILVQLCPIQRPVGGWRQLKTINLLLWAEFFTPRWHSLCQPWNKDVTMQEVRAHRVQPSPPLNHLNTFSYSKTISPKVASLNVTHFICVVGPDDCICGALENSSCILRKHRHQHHLFFTQ